MQWYQIDINLTLPLLESTYQFLWPYVNGIQVKMNENFFSVKAFLFSSDPGTISDKVRRFLHIKARSVHGEFSHLLINEMDISLNDDFIIVPFPASHIPPFGIPILIQRGRAFGTGSHPYTIYCLQALKYIFKEDPTGSQLKQILDAGMGTGILSIAASKMGEKDITGVEINAESIQEAQENVRLNKLGEAIRILHCSITSVKGQYRIIFANLFGSLLMEIASYLKELLVSGGWLVIGGMSAANKEVVISCFMQYGLKEHIRCFDEEWRQQFYRSFEYTND